MSACAQAGMTEAEIDCVGVATKDRSERLRLKGLLTDAQRIILWLERRTIVISMDRGLCPV